MKEQLKEIILQIGIEQAESVLDEIKKESLFQNKDTEAREFLVGIFNRMKVRVEKDCPNSVFYDVDGLGTVFEQDTKNNRLWVSNRHVWSILESKFDNCQQGRELIAGTVEDILKWEGYTPISAEVTPKEDGWKTS